MPAASMTEASMARYECLVCGYVYDEAKERTGWDRLPEDWACPVCAAAKSQFRSLSGAETGGAKSEAGPAGGAGQAIVVHRVFGYVFLAVYLLLMFQMVPRLWTYQIEFPARTMVHVALGIAVGVSLLLKIAIVRFFRRLDQALVPALGTFVLVGSVVLITIAVPSAFREAVATAKLFTEENRQRVGLLLAQTGFDEEECRRLASADSLRAGQRVLRQECVQCHDLRTVLARPRTPQNWWQTVQRMADRTTPMNPLEPDEQKRVTAYLIALSPQLQRSTGKQRDEEDRRDQSQRAAEAVFAGEAETASLDPEAGKQLFETRCSQCHPPALVDEVPLGSEGDARALVTRMVGEGLEATEDELSQIVRYLTAAHAKAPE
jgi:rubredoxin/mono/diheme cytochrome c family protein